MTKTNMYVAVDHFHGHSTWSNILESLMDSSYYQNVRQHEKYVSFEGGDPKNDVNRWYKQGQTKVSVIHVECQMMSPGLWSMAVSFYNNRSLSKRVSPRGELRYVFAYVPTNVVKSTAEAIANGGFPAMKALCTGPLVQYAG